MPDTEDAAVIAALRSAFNIQRRAFAADRNPTLTARQERLGALIGMMAANRARIADAVAQDFGAHPRGASDLIEVAGVIGRAAHVIEHLEAWMQPSPREVDTAVYGTASAHIAYQPKGVIGNMVPWNFPFDLSVGPMVDMLAAGNRVIVKPSEYAPASAALLAEMIAACFDPDLVTVVVGEIDLARAFAATPWDHLLYTGSPDVGRQVMAAAAANLTPVTLELGGKCPAILTPGSVTPRNVESVIGTKMVKNGQMCVSVDYALVPRAELETFIVRAGAFMRGAAPGYAKGDECTGIISDRHLARLETILDEAATRHTRIVTLEDNPAINRARRCMPLSLMIDPAPDTQVMQQEIFGPLLPVIPYDTLDEAIALVNAGDRPLGLYVFGDEALTTRVLDETHSGGAAVNTCAVQSALPSMGFGGSGMSGMGRHHGIEGFREFSNPRGVVVRGEGDLIDAFYAPYGKAVAVVDAALMPC
ncbi:aldehyde dehydrogenase family protein [Sphingomonas sp. GB1N7]|uniref:aldehyde dehydrogenase family protein n=1 Tax=Parasphingomonas caseinilytica TaxID=3096158 RepID=UPI002FC61EA5